MGVPPLAPARPGPPGARPHRQPFAVLLVEDDDGDALLVEELLADGLPEATVRRARTVAEAEAMLGRGFAAALLDLGLPDAVGTDGVSRLQAAGPEVAIVVLTAANDEKLGQKAVAAGAQDFLVKGQADDRVLARSLLYAIQRQRAEVAGRKLFEAERRRAENERMARALLPRPVLRSGVVALEVEYRPGNEGAQLGGDFYDAVELDDGSVRLVIGDVSGHGPDEAALGATLRASWRGLVMAGLPTAEVLAVLDRQIRTESQQSAAFATACAVDVDATGRRCAVTSAGHPPPFAVLDDDLLPVPDGGGPLLGVLPDPAWSPVELELPRPWAILLFTDGLTESRREPGSVERVGEAEAARRFLDHRRRGLRGAGLVRALVEDAEAGHGGPLDDDLAVCLVEGPER